MQCCVPRQHFHPHPIFHWKSGLNNHTAAVRIQDCLLRHQFYKLNSTGISADVLQIKAPNASLVKQSTSKPQSQSTVNSHNIKQRKKCPKTQSANFSSTFCFRLRSKTSSISSTRVPSQKLSSATFTNQSFSHLPISQPSAICLPCLPGSTQTSWYSQRSLEPALFSAGMT